jgi:hypothetical protein
MTVKKTRKKTAKKTATRRGDPDVVEKRRAARALNTVLGKRAAPKQDKRTMRRINRLLDEIRAGKNGQGRNLQPMTVVQHAAELLERGVPLKDIRASAGRKHYVTEQSDEVMDAVVQAQAAYDFDMRAWLVIGIRMQQP